VRKPRGAHGKTALVAGEKARPALALRFRSSKATVGYCRGPASGWMAVYVDGKLRTSLSTYNAFSKCGSTYVVKGLDGSKQHTVTVVETHRAGPRDGTQVVIDYFSVV
jgi:hypothetical protein